MGKSKRIRKLRDVVVSILLLSSLVFGSLLVSCSEEDGILVQPTSNTGGPNLVGSPISNGITSAFQSIGKGAAGQIGKVGIGWFLGAIGITTQSQGWEEQLARIEQDLDSIVTLLSIADSELRAIDSTLNIINCAEQQSSLQTEIGTIKNLYDQYNAILATASEGDTVANSILQDWSDQVLAEGNHTANISVGIILGTIQANLETNSGAIIACIQNISKPSSGSFGLDTLYYNQASQFFNYYYYYQTIALGMLSEAYHYRAWVNAGSPGSTYATADSVQKVCTENGTSQNDCNNVVVQTNTQYNALIGQLMDVGGPITSEYLLYQVNSSNEPVVWVRSMQDFTTQSGSNCTYPLSMYNLCGSLVGVANSTLNFTKYRGTQGFQFAEITELSLLVNEYNTNSFANVSDYLKSVGFKDTDTGLIFIPAGLIKFDGGFAGDVYAIPFIDASMKNHGYFSSNNFNGILPYSLHGDSPCGPYEFEYDVNYNNGATIKNDWYKLSGKSKICKGDYGGYVVSNNLSWSSSSTAPGWAYNGNSSTSVPINSATSKAFHLPIRKDFTGTTGCLNGRSNYNKANMLTMCNDDFSSYLNSNIPKPPTCNTGINPPCTSF